MVGLEIHFLRYIYYGIIDDSHDPLASWDLILLISICIPMYLLFLEFLTIPSHIKDMHFEGKILLFVAPVNLIVIFTYENECLLSMALLYVVFTGFLLLYISEEQERKHDDRMSKKHGRSWDKYKEDKDHSVTQQMMQSINSPISTLAGFS